MLTSILDPTLTPADLGLPGERFPSFRTAQVEALEYALYGQNPSLGPKPYVLAGLPPGVGKALLAQAIGKMSGVKFAVLTATRALEDQAAKDFSSTGLVNIRGKANYTCREPKLETNDKGEVVGREEQSCEEGGDSGCQFAGTPRCTYGGRYEQAKMADSILSNYAYWFHARARGGALETLNNPIKMLICDEAHLSYQSLANHLSIWVGDRDLKQYADQQVRDCLRAGAGAEWGRVNQQWMGMIDSVYGQADARTQNLAAQYGGETKARRSSKEYRRLTRLMSNLERVLEHGGDNNWVWRQTSRPYPGLSFDCIWPGRYASKYLWSGVERVVLLSATLRPKHAGLLGLGSTQYSFREWPRQFPAQLNPVYWLPTGKMGHKESLETKLLAVAKHDQIVEAGWGRYKGLVHTGSYARAEWLQANSKYGRRMILPSQGSNGLTAGEALERHLAAKDPTTLVGPVYVTGWDLPDEACRWIHWLKLPYPDRSDPMVLARAESDPEWYDCETMQGLAQGCGRGARHNTDWAWVFITDDSVDRFRKYAGRFAPGWFKVVDGAKDGRVPGPPC